MAALLRSSLLVRPAGDDPAGGEADAPRVRLLESIRDFAREQLAASGEHVALERRHAAYYHALALEAGPHLAGPDQSAWLGRLAREEHNLRAAVRALLDLGQAETAVGLVWALWRYWRFSGGRWDARRWGEEALGGAHGALTPGGRARALVLAGMACAPAEAPAARATLEEGLRGCQEAGDARGQGLALLLLGTLALAAGDGPGALARFEASLPHFRAAGEAWGAAFALLNLGVPPLRQGDLDGAERRFEAGLAAARAAGDGGATHRALYSLGVLARARGDEHGAVQRFAAGLTQAGAMGDRVNVGYLVKALAEVAAGRGRPLEAARLLGTAEAVLQDTGAPLHRYGVEERWHEQALATARAALGPAAVERARAEGRTLPVEAAIAGALRAAGVAGAGEAAGGPPPAEEGVEQLGRHEQRHGPGQGHEVPPRAHAPDQDPPEQAADGGPPADEGRPPGRASSRGRAAAGPAGARRAAGSRPAR